MMVNPIRRLPGKAESGKQFDGSHFHYLAFCFRSAAAVTAIALPSLAAVHRDDKTSRLYRIITSHYAVFVAESDVNPQKCHIL